MRETSVMPFLAVEGSLLHLFLSIVSFYALIARFDLLLNSFFLVLSEWCRSFNWLPHAMMRREEGFSGYERFNVIMNVFWQRRSRPADLIRFDKTSSSFPSHLDKIQVIQVSNTFIFQYFWLWLCILKSKRCYLVHIHTWTDTFCC
jgi:hypothetical protein